MVDAIQTQGFKLEVENTGSPDEFTEVVGITNFSGFNGQAAEIDATHLQSSAKEFLMGLQDFGNFEVDVNHLPDDPGQMILRAAKTSRTLKDFRITFSDANTATFSGYVLSNPISGGVDAKVDGSFNIRISGSVTFA